VRVWNLRFRCNIKGSGFRATGLRVKGEGYRKKDKTLIVGELELGLEVFGLWA